MLRYCVVLNGGWGAWGVGAWRRRRGEEGEPLCVVVCPVVTNPGYDGPSFEYWSPNASGVYVARSRPARADAFTPASSVCNVPLGER